MIRRTLPIKAVILLYDWVLTLDMEVCSTVYRVARVPNAQMSSIGGVRLASATISSKSPLLYKSMVCASVSGNHCLP